MANQKMDFKCRICGSKSFNDLTGNINGINGFECDGCGVVFWNVKKFTIPEDFPCLDEKVEILDENLNNHQFGGEHT